MTMTAERPQTVSERIPNTGCFTVSYRDFLGVLRAVGVAVGRARNLPVLSRVLVTVGAGEVEVTAFDFDLAVTVPLPAGAVVPGRMLLDHAATVKVLQAAVKGVPARDLDRLEVHVAAVDNQPELGVAGYRVPLDNSVTVDAFPALPPAAPGGHTMGRDDFTTLVTRVAVAADKNGSLPLLTGIWTRLTTRLVEMAATDRFRVACGTARAVGAEPAAILLPCGPLTALLPHLTGPQVTIGVTETDAGSWATITSGHLTARVRGIVGDYPPVERLLHRAPTDTLIVDRQALLTAATRATAISAAVAAKTTPVRLTAGSTGVILAPANDHSPTRVTAPLVPALAGSVDTSWTTGLNPTYLLDAVKSLTTDQVILYLADRAPVMLTDDGAARVTYQHMMMPVRLAQDT